MPSPLQFSAKLDLETVERVIRHRVDTLRTVPGFLPWFYDHLREKGPAMSEVVGSLKARL